MWRRAMALLGFGSADKLTRLDEAMASTVAAQEGVQRAGNDAAKTASRRRRETIVQRRQARLAARKLQEQALNTSEVRILVDDMLRGMDPPQGGKDNRPC